MEIDIDNGLPFDYIVEALEIFSKENFIRVNSDIKNIGTLIDFEAGLYRIFPRYSSEVNIKLSNGNNFRFYQGTEQLKYIEFNITDKDKGTDKSKSEFYSKCRLLKEREEIVAFSSRYKRDGIRNPFEERLSKYIKLPEKFGNVGAKLWYWDPFYFYISFPYQNFEEIETFFPLSEERNKIIDKRTAEIIRDPIVCNSKGRWMSVILNIVSGNYDVEYAGKKFNISNRKIRKKLHELKDPMFTIIKDRIIEGRNETIAGCKKEYIGLITKPVYKSLKYLVSNGFSEKLTEEYNKWADENEYPKITEEDFRKFLK